MGDSFVTDLSAGEVRPFAAHGKATIGSAGGLSLMMADFEPGWRWSTDVAPLAGTTSCQTHHLGYVLAGRMGVKTDAGEQIEVGPGQLFDLPAGHDAWVIGDETCKVLDFSPDATRYATGPAQRVAPYPDRSVELVRQGYEAFNTGDIATLTSILAIDCMQHVPGRSQFAGEYKGIDAVLAYYGKLAELTNNQFRADLIETHSDGRGHVTAIHQITATYNGVTRVSRGSILFTFYGDRATDMLELRGDLAGDDAFFS
jgi:ketosteroid isomerase-like protein